MFLLGIQYRDHVPESRVRLVDWHHVQGCYLNGNNGCCVGDAGAGIYPVGVSPSFFELL